MPSRMELLANRLLDGVDLRHELRLNVDGCVIDVATNDVALRDHLHRYFAELVTEPGNPACDFSISAVEAPRLRLAADWAVKEPEPGKSKIKEEWVDLPGGRVVRKRLTGMTFAFGEDLHLAYGPCRTHANQVVNFINNRYMQWRLRQGFLLAHASAVGREGHCLVLCGPSGAGKSTTALALVSEGMDFVTNDRLLMRGTDRGVECYGIPKHPRVNPGTVLNNPLLVDMIDEPTRSRLLALPEAELRVLEDKYDVLIDRHMGPGRFRMHGNIEALIVFNWSDGAPFARDADLGRRPELLSLITKSPGIFYEPEQGAYRAKAGVRSHPCDDRYLETLRHCRVVELGGRQDFGAATRLCREVFGSCTSTTTPGVPAIRRHPRTG